MRTPQSHTPREKVLAEIRQRPDAGTRPAPETSAAGTATMRVADAAVIALAASPVIESAVVLAGAPSFGAPIKEVLAYHAEHRGSVSIAVGLQALYQLRELVNRYEQVAAATMDAQQRTATDIAEVRARTAAIEQVLRTVE